MILSVVIPVYNVEQYVAQCLDSVINQNFDDMEIICVNDGSTDKSREILQQYEMTYSQVHVIDQPNGGLSAARNTGQRNATGKYIYFLDSDDYLYPQVLHKMVNYAEEHHLEMVCFNVLNNGEKPEYKTNISILPLTGIEYAKQMKQLFGMPYDMPLWLYLYRRDFLVQNHLWNTEGRLHEDEEFTPRAIYQTNAIALLNIPIQYHRLKRNGSITSSIGIKNYQDLVMNFDDLYKFFQGKINTLEFTNCLCFSMATTIIQAGKNQYCTKDIGFSLKKALQYIRLSKMGLAAEQKLLLGGISTKLAYRYTQQLYPKTILSILNIITMIIIKTIKTI